MKIELNAVVKTVVDLGKEITPELIEAAKRDFQDMPIGACLFWKIDTKLIEDDENVSSSIRDF